MRIESELINPSTEELTFGNCCRIEALDAIEACTTVTQVQLGNFLPAAVQEKLQTIATRNRELARFIANPRAYLGDELVKLIRKLDNCPTGRYMLARCLPGITSFVKIKSTDSSTTGSKKRRVRY